MKKIIIALLLITASARLKAQQLVVTPDLKLNNGLQKDYFKPDSLSKFTLPKLDADISPGIFNSKTRGNIVYSTMPVLKPSLSSVERMPVAMLGNGDMKYTMKVEKVTVINPLAPVTTQQP